MSENDLKSARRLFVEALTANWQRVRDVYMPAGPSTRDDKFVWNWVRNARSEDVRAILDSTPDPSSRLAAAWIQYHPEWVKAVCQDAIAAAVHELRQAKRDKRADRRRKMRGAGGRVTKGGRQVYKRPRGRPPAPPVVNVSLENAARKKL